MTILTTGVTSPNGNTPLVARQEIRTLLKDTDVMDVFILGLERFQSVSQSDLLSWFQIAGIHGR
jgi:tyrosinase